MFYRLKDDFALRGWEKLPYALINLKFGEVYFIQKQEHDALMLCDGSIDVDSVFVSEEQREIIKSAEEKGIIAPCSFGENLKDIQKYHKYPARYIKTAHWSITGRCNFRCKHCYMSAPDAKFGELSHDVCMKIIDELAECGVMNISITGGEALVRKDFFELLDEMLSKNIHVTTIYSNGKLITDEFLDELEKRRIYPEINMSFDGVGWHDWLRGIDGAEKMVIDAFTRCKRRGFPTGAEMCLHQKNKHTLRESINLLAKLGCSHVKTNPVAPVGAWLENAENDTLTMPETFDIYLEYIPHFFEDGAPMNIMLGGFFYARKGQKSWFIPAKRFDGQESSLRKCVCGHARLVMYIAADGRVLPCMALSGMDIQEEFPLVTEIGLKNCLNDSSFMDMVSLRLEDFLKHNPECQDCEYSLICGGGCRAGALQDSPDFLAPDEAACLMFKGGYAKKLQAVMDGLNFK